MRSGPLAKRKRERDTIRVVGAMVKEGEREGLRWVGVGRVLLLNGGMIEGRNLVKKRVMEDGTCYTISKETKSNA